MKRNLFLGFALLVFLFVGGQTSSAQTDTLYGRVTDTNGNGISNVTVTIYQSGNSPYCPNTTVTGLTNGFGYYSAEIHYYCSALIQPSAKQYTFTPAYRFLDFQIDDYSNVTFVGTHQ